MKTKIVFLVLVNVGLTLPVSGLTSTCWDATKQNKTLTRLMWCHVKQDTEEVTTEDLIKVNLYYTLPPA